MKKILLLLVLVAPSFTGCSFLTTTGKAICSARVEVSQSISNIGMAFGPAGTTITDVINASLELFCTVFSQALSTPDNVCEECLALFRSDEPTTKPITGSK